VVTIAIPVSVELWLYPDSYGHRDWNLDRNFDWHLYRYPDGHLNWYSDGDFNRDFDGNSDGDFDWNLNGNQPLPLDIDLAVSAARLTAVTSAALTALAALLRWVDIHGDHIDGIIWFGKCQRWRRWWFYNNWWRCRSWDDSCHLPPDGLGPRECRLKIEIFLGVTVFSCCRHCVRLVSNRLEH
jgi:hypothetical protein